MHRPGLTNDLVKRSDLIQKLEQNRHKPLTLVSAPTGYGKSILVSQWLELSKAVSIWISLDEDHNDLRTFLGYLNAGLDSLSAEIPEDIENLMESARLPEVKEIATYYLNMFDGLQEEIILVLDDYYFITNPDIHELLRQILKYLPPQVHLVIPTRRDPPLGLPAMRANNKLNELGISDLCFTEPDIVELNRKLLDIELSHDSARSLLEKTEGWVVGLRMASLMVTDTENAEQEYESFSGSMHLISDFLVSEVLAKQPKALREMLIKSSVLNRFCTELLDEVFPEDNRGKEQSTDAGEFMKWLINANLFTVQLDNEKTWFRYHHLFRDLLKKEFLRNEKFEVQQDLCYRASLWFEKKGFISEAIDCAVEAENYPRALEIIENHWTHVFNQEFWFVVENWIQRLPESVADNSTMVQFIRIWIMHSKHQLSELPPILDRISAINAKLSDMEEGYMAFVQCMFTYYSGQVEPALQLAEKALRQIPTEQVRFLADIGSWYMIILQSLGREDEALEQIDNSLKATGMEGDTIVLTRLRAQQFYIHTIGANFYGVHAAAREFAKIGGMKGFTLGFKGYFLGSSHWWQNDHQGVIDHIDPAITHRYQSNFRLAVEAYLIKAISFQKLHMETEANREIALMQDFAGKIMDADIIAISGSGVARLALLQGDMAAAKNWLHSTEVPALLPTEMFWIESPVITRCRVLISLGKENYLQEALSVLEKNRALAESWHNKLRIIEITVLQAIAFDALGKRDQAEQHLKTALQLAAKGAWMRPFIEEGGAIKHLLQALMEEVVESEFISEILEAISKEEQLQSPAQDEAAVKYLPAAGQVSASSLSKRELEVLTLVAQGLKNKEIGRRMYVSEYTVKKHIYNMFKKLEVESRIALLQKAQETGILKPE
ncbi:MAG: LuxR C-terminal-related transcriptional regulator [Bacteroides sp.]|nr:LuxR C-terminal-related transcriptional regulator [Bacteroides sp.]